MTLLLWIAACRAPELPQPEIVGVSPERVWNGADVPIVVLGTNFFPQIEVDARGLGTDYDRDWKAWLVSEDVGKRTPLAGVAVDDTEHLRAVVERGLPAGRYLLEVEGPTGRTASSGPLLTLSDTLEVGFSVSYYDDPAAYVAGEQVRFLVMAVGQDGQRVINDVPVLFSMTGATTELASTVAFDDVDVLPEGVGFRGVIPDGAAVAVVDLLAPGRLDVVAQSPPGQADLQQGVLTLVVGGGSDLPARLELPRRVLDEGAVAGRPFDVQITVTDAGGNVVDEPLELRLENTCGGYRDDVVVRGPTEITVAVTEATQRNGCAQDQLVVTSGARGSSESFQVIGAPASSFELFALAEELVAGDDTLLLVVRPRDDFDNSTAYSGTVTLTDPLGSLVASECEQAPFLFLCSATAVVAGDELEIVAKGSDGVQGALGGFRVSPSPVVAEVGVSADPAVAGQAAEVSVQTFDPFGNAHVQGQVDPAGLVFDDELGDVVCSAAQAELDGTLRADCTFTVARDATLSARVGGAAGVAPVEVVNGELARVDLTAPSSVAAGQGFLFDLVSYDAFGNRYVVQTDPSIDLRSTLGSLTPSSTLLGPGGTARVSGTLTRAGIHRIEAVREGVTVGTSDPVTVSAGPTTGLSVEVEVPWGWVGEATPVQVESVDAWSNRTAVTASVTLTSRNGIAATRVVNLVNGVASLDWTWTGTAVAEVIDASSGTFLGASPPRYVVRDCGATGPTLALAFAGLAEPVACFDPTLGRATVVGDFAGSVPFGGRNLIGYGLSWGDTVITSGAPAVSLPIEAIGANPVAALLVQSDACAAEHATLAWIGLDDGSATGPLLLETVAPGLEASDVADVTLTGATDCAGDPAADALVRLRASLGSLSGVTASGEGLEVQLDLAGDGAFQVTTGSVIGGDAVTLHAWVGDGSALGSLDIPLLDETVRPTVRAMAPSGETSGQVATIEVDFSEPLLAAGVTPGRFTLTGPGAASVSQVVLSDGDRHASLVLSEPADASAGTWTLTASSDLRDARGNRLSGDWSGDRADYVGTFGAVGVGVTSVSCGSVTPEGGVFRPDGDDGAGAEADTLQVELVAAAAPSWWVAEVRDLGDALVRQAWVVPAGAADTWSWDGRDDEGQVVANGSYTLDIFPEDAVGNRGGGCVVQVHVDNRVGVLP